MLLAIFRIALVLCLLATPALAMEQAATSGASASESRGGAEDRWWGHPFVFCWTTDDAHTTNAPYDSLFTARDLAYTLFVNPLLSQLYGSSYVLSPEALNSYYEHGHEIAGHSYSHAGLWNDRLPPAGNAGGQISVADTLAHGTPAGYQGSAGAGALQGYFHPGVWDSLGWDWDNAEQHYYRTDLTHRQHFLAEISRDSVATIIDIPPDEVTTFAFPQFRYSSAIIDSLIAAGYQGARFGGYPNSPSQGDIANDPRNSWASISLFRVPMLFPIHVVITDDGAGDTLEHGCSESEFKAAVTPYFSYLVESGGMGVLMSHVSSGNWAWDNSYLTAEEVGWVLDVVADHGGIVKTFGEAVAYYRANAPYHLRLSTGDEVWGTEPIHEFPSGVEITDESDGETPAVRLVGIRPNPFNPTTEIRLELDRPAVMAMGAQPLTRA